MNGRLIGWMGLLAILLQGCTGFGMRSTPAPVADASRAPPRAAPPRPVEVYPYRGGGSAAPEAVTAPGYGPGTGYPPPPAGSAGYAPPAHYPPPPPGTGDTPPSVTQPPSGWQPYGGGTPAADAGGLWVPETPPPATDARPRPPAPASAPAPAEPTTSAAPPPPPTAGQDLALRSTPPPMQASKPVEQLMKQAEGQQAAGDLTGAAGTLERAIGIEPRNAHLWNRLARVRLAAGQGPQAGDLAAKSNTLAGDNPGLKQDNWRIIATARRQAGDAAGAQAAEARVGGR